MAYPLLLFGQIIDVYSENIQHTLREKFRVSLIPKLSVGSVTTTHYTHVPELFPGGICLQSRPDYMRIDRGSLSYSLVFRRVFK